MPKKRWQTRFERFQGTRRHNALRRGGSSGQLYFLRNTNQLETSLAAFGVLNYVFSTGPYQPKTLLSWAESFRNSRGHWNSMIYVDLTGNTRTNLLWASFKMSVKMIVCGLWLIDVSILIVLLTAAKRQSLVRLWISAFVCYWKGQ